MSEIENWLSELELEKYVSAFVEAEIAFDDLPHLTDEDLKEVGLPVGPRRRVSEAIKRLGAAYASPVDTPEDAAHPAPEKSEPAPAAGPAGSPYRLSMPAPEAHHPKTERYPQNQRRKRCWARHPHGMKSHRPLGRRL